MKNWALVMLFYSTLYAGVCKADVSNPLQCKDWPIVVRCGNESHCLESGKAKYRGSNAYYVNNAGQKVFAIGLSQMEPVQTMVYKNPETGETFWDCAHYSCNGDFGSTVVDCGNGFHSP